jgi:hypothetical protein
MIELLAGIGLPIAELPPDEQVRAARFMGAVLGAFSMEELIGIAEDAPLEELRGAVPVVVQLLEVVPGELRTLIPQPVAELLPVLLAPLVVQWGASPPRCWPTPTRPTARQPRPCRRRLRRWSRCRFPALPGSPNLTRGARERPARGSGPRHGDRRGRARQVRHVRGAVLARRGGGHPHKRLMGRLVRRKLLQVYPEIVAALVAAADQQVTSSARR